MGLIFLSFVVITGIGGQVSLAQATFVTAGGLAAGWALNYDWGVDLPLVASHGQLNFLLAALLGAIVGAGDRRAGRASGPPPERREPRHRHPGARVRRRRPRVRSERLQQRLSGWAIRTPTIDLPVLNWINDLLLEGRTNRSSTSRWSKTRSS